VVVCPIWGEGGANVKLAEALQYGCVTVASKDAADGFEPIIKPGENMLVADTPEIMIDTLCSAVKNPHLLDELRENARLLTEDVLSQSYFDHVIQQVVRATVQTYPDDCLTEVGERQQ